MISFIRILKDSDNHERVKPDFSEEIRIFPYSKEFSIKRKGSIKEIRVKGHPGFVRLFDIASLVSEKKILLYLSERNKKNLLEIKKVSKELFKDEKLFCLSFSTNEIPRLIYKKKYGALTCLWESNDFNKIDQIPFFNRECFALSKRVFFKLGGFSTRFFHKYYHDVDISIRARKKGYKLILLNQKNISRINDDTKIFDPFYKESNRVALNMRHLKRRDKIRNLAFTLKETPCLIKQKRFLEVTGRFHGLVKNA
ncbi:MAG: hypothetical protein C0601_02475 [Candidatus Muiribacterium halophilum]|uniref:Uncharacterized protein n=1 Tax=Muiribacterium halophilum TaxID=2053465 RepID=A0A2N5ZKQ0_MUIH1|nr:MAG: hypothetical protein C0601_02475 [Candidatus Muirbacterium halophilum]